ncbi:MAG: Bacterial alpha-L-rhamnosidase [Clostridia bacterium]|nr:Bacterial alpha-L-rhamnosidase [Clostridia bacterium]
MFKPINIAVDNGKLQKSNRYRITSNKSPVISWGASTDVKNAFQTSYKIRIFTNDEVLWDIDSKNSSEQSVLYKGKELPVGERINIELCLVDTYGNISETAFDYFFYGKLETWNAEWIAASEDIEKEAVYFRKDINLKKEIKSACIYACGIGYHKLYINGNEIDSSKLEPVHSDYSKTCYYAVIPELEGFLKESKNCLSAVLGEGWRRNNGGYINALGERKVEFFGIPQFTCILQIKYKDGSVEYINTDKSWSYCKGPIIENNLFDGETYDANKTILNWNNIDYSGDDFKQIKIVPSPCKRIIPQLLEPICEKIIYKPLSVTAISKDACILDFGQNIAGVVHLKLPAKMSKGTVITLNHAEFLNEDGTLFTAPLRGAAATDMYIASGDEKELKEWQPIFVYHGFRYAQITGMGGNIDKNDVYAVSLHTDLDTGSFFNCGSALVNQIQKNIVQTERANMHGILTDCPQRDERMGWMNDATVRFEETPYNFNIGRMFPKIIEDLLDTQGDDGSITCTAPYIYGSRPADPVCSSFLIAGMQAFLHTGNTEIIKRAYDGFAAWEEFLGKHSENYIINYTYYGDWAGPAYACVGEDGAFSSVTPGIFMSTGYYYLNAVLLSRFAKILNNEKDYLKYTELSENIKAAFLSIWWDENTGIVGSGSQGCQAFALWLRILPEDGRKKAAEIMSENLKDSNYKITTGNLCTRYLMDMLAEYGYIDDAWMVVTSEEYPSWGYMIQNEATTVWERFELKKNPGMNSHNHPMYGALGYWFYAYIAGIKPIDRGYNEVDIKPFIPENLLSAHSSVDTVKGDLTVKWVKRYGKVYLYVTVPFGVIANIYFDDKKISVGSGSWQFDKLI